MRASDMESGRWIREGATLVLHGGGPGIRASLARKSALDEILFETPAPRRPVLLSHFHIRKVRDPARGGALTPAASASLMTPAEMQPGYLLPQHPQRQALQGALTTLLRTKHAAALSPAVNLRVALADLTGAKHHAPIFAGFYAWGAGAAFEGASLTKILALYALYQLRFDLDFCASFFGITTGPALEAAMKKEWAKKGLRTPPKLTDLFTFVRPAGKPVTARLRTEHDIHHNHVARALILQLGFEYIGSVALQSGLFDEAQGGLWLNAAYNEPAVTWTTSPFPRLERHNATALATATFFALLAQGRLVNQTTSTEIRNVLAKRVCMSHGLLEGIQGLGGVQASPPNKCGILSPLFHEGLHVIRQVSAGKRVEYVAAVLSKEPPVVDFEALGRDLDSLIVAANP